jgi:hypothetical protein
VCGHAWCRLGLCARRAGLLLIHRAAAIDAFEELRCGEGAGARPGQQRTDEEKRRSAPQRAHRAAAGGAGNAICSPTVSGRIRRHRPRVLMSTTIGVTSFAVAHRFKARTP